MPFEPKLVTGDLLAGRYRMERILGQGGMSRVYLASDLKLPGKVWAVKEIRAMPGEPLSVAQEARLLITLNHHRLPRIVDFVDTDQEGYAYIVMDYIEGEPLDRRVKAQGGRLSQEELTRIGLQIVEGLHYLHNHRPPVIHRDVKPSNLLMDGSGELRFVDFGIARTFVAGQAEDTVQLGTVGFASPEQYGGRQSDGRSDLYSLGAVLLYLGTGCKHTALTGEAERAFRRNGHGSLLPVVGRLMQTLPEARFPSAEAVFEALRTCGIRPQGREERSHAPGVVDVTSSRTSGGRTTVIALMGAATGVGTTHTAIALAHVLARGFNKVAIVEMDAGAAAFNRLARRIAGESAAAAGGFARPLRIGDVDYVKLSSRSEFIALLTDGYEWIVCDFGTGRSKEQMEEFRRANLSLIVGSGAAWRSGELESFVESTVGAGSFPGHWRFCIPMASTDALRRLHRTLHTRSVHGIPAEQNPFEPGPEASAALQAVCGDLLPRPKRSGRGFLAKQKM
ncbi:protein kinase domain-containing protein [Paenibacillus macerans]|uniref:serine/threonine-protein kinase n=1 Tax=Paenibacillus macerans TaxID=44252 RepID=UPI003D31E811